MSDRNIEYSDQFGFNIFKKEIIDELGEEAWQKLIKEIDLPDIENESKCKCINMYSFMYRFDQTADKHTANKILSRVRHGLKPSQCAWAREKFLKCKDLDDFIKESIKEGIADFEKLYNGNKDFYGQPITKEVFDFIKQNPEMLSGIRDGNKMYFMAFPANMKEYLNTTDIRTKRYYACHCPFAKESILSDKIVSSTLCYCSLGHIKNFWEAVFDAELDGEVIASVLNGDLACRYVISLPDDVMKLYVKSTDTE